MATEIGFAGEDFGIDAEVAGGEDVAFDVIGEEAFRGGALGVGNGGGVDALVGFHGFFGVGEGEGVEVFEDGVAFAEPLVVEVVGVGQENEAVVLLEGEDEFFAGGGVGEEDGVPDFAESLEGEGEAEQGGEAVEELFGFELAGFIGVVQTGVADALGDLGLGEAGVVAEGLVATVDVEWNQYVTHVEEEGSDHASSWYEKKSKKMACFLSGIRLPE